MLKSWTSEITGVDSSRSFQNFSSFLELSINETQLSGRQFSIFFLSCLHVPNALLLLLNTLGKISVESNLPLKKI